MKILLYDICCGAGGCSVGYSRAGFEVVGVDHKPFKRYPFRMIVMDALRFLREYIDGKHPPAAAIHASFPCQGFCALKHMPNAKKHPDLVTPGRELLLRIGLPYVIENVPGSPLRNPTVLCGTMFGLGTGDAELRRHRLFETNWPLVLPMGMHCRHGRRGKKVICVIGGHGQPGLSRGRQSRAPRMTGHSGIAEDRAANRDGLIYFSSAERNEAMGIDWMKGGEISQAIPPDYTRFVGAQLMKIVGHK
jgi:DNA (cytosine-5)-methyltransferase 1